MRRTLARAAGPVTSAAIALAALSGCAAPSHPAGAGRVVAFRCADHSDITVDFVANHAVLHADGSTWTLALQRSGSGFRYAGAGQSLRGKGAALDWTESGGTTHRCTAMNWP
ncbi:MAG: MliC family protein [Rhodospirillales bacterium]|nr:MliC family protein [Rhodospirillales bacterium]